MRVASFSHCLSLSPSSSSSLPLIFSRVLSSSLSLSRASAFQIYGENALKILAYISIDSNDELVWKEFSERLFDLITCRHHSSGDQILTDNSTHMSQDLFCLHSFLSHSFYISSHFISSFVIVNAC